MMTAGVSWMIASAVTDPECRIDRSASAVIAPVGVVLTTALAAIDPETVLSTTASAVMASVIVEPPVSIQASAVIEDLKSKRCTTKQAAILKRFGYDVAGLDVPKASELIDRIKANGWKRPDAA